MKQIPLSGKRGKGKYALVDDEDYVWAIKFKWFLSKAGYVARSIHVPKKEGTSKCRNRCIYLHREVLGISGTPMLGDHKFGNKLDNRSTKLRKCTHRENIRNSKKAENNTSKYKGVYWYKKGNKWSVQITVNYKNIYLGRFPKDQEIEAARAYNKAARFHHGEFARLNKF